MLMGPSQHQHGGTTSSSSSSSPSSSEAAAATNETIVPVMPSTANSDAREERRRHDESDAIQLFLQQFLPTATTDATSTTTVNTTSPNPIALLQQLYNQTQPKQEQDKSIKPWFHYVDWKDDDNKYNWTCYIIVPASLIKLWKLKSSGGVYYSGRLLGISSSLMNTKKIENDDGDDADRCDGSDAENNFTETTGLQADHDPLDDALLHLCGEWSAVSVSPAATTTCAKSLTENEHIRFKLKKGAEKSAALNLLFAIAMERLDNDNEDTTINYEVDDVCASVESSSSNRIIPKQVVEGGDEVRLQLHKLQLYGNVQYPENDEYLSRDNPCKVRCVVSVLNIAKNGCGDGDDAIHEVTSDWHNNADDSIHDAYHKLKTKHETLSLHGNDAQMKKCMVNILSEMQKRSKTTIIAYEESLPNWATAKIGSKFYLHELEFSIVNNCDTEHTEQSGDDVTDSKKTSMSKFMQVDDDAATRVGIVCGCASLEYGLCADFEWTGIADNDTQRVVRVAITNSTEVSHSDMMQQIEQVSPAIQLEEGGCPVSLTKCFNKIVFDYGKQYGMGPKPVWNELLDAVTSCNDVEFGNSRNFMFVPLLPKSDGTHANSSTCGIDWEVMYNVVHHKTTSIVDATSPSCLRNRFITQPTGFGGRVFIAKNEINVIETPSSPLLSMELALQLPDQLKEKLRTTFLGCELSNITYAQYFEQVHRYSIQHPEKPLVAARSLSQLTYEQHELQLRHRQSGESSKAQSIAYSPRCSISNILTDRGLLVPELVHIFPLPRDFLYICRRASSFMPKLERAQTLLAVASRLRKLQQNGIARGIAPAHSVSTDNLLPLVDKATTRGSTSNNGSALLVRDHERLETLGDSVLLFFIVLNIFAKLSITDDEFVLDIFDRMISVQGKNRILFNAAMQIGLHRLIHDGSASKSSWKSKYQTASKVSCIRAIEIAPKQLSDTVESIIGATYLADQSGSMTVGFLNQIGPDFPDMFDSDGSTCDQAIGWFAAKGTCIKEGFPFTEHPRWVDELERIQEIMNRHPDIYSTLQRNTAGFREMLACRTSLHDHIGMMKSDSTALLLIHAALFDDSLDNNQYNHDGSDLEKIAQLRDKIFNVGNATLQLSIVTEIYHMYPESTSGDFQLMKSALMSHDALAYIFVKNGFHTVLFDTDADAISIMQGYVKEADLVGGKEWTKNGGWIIPGGIEEFHKRVHLHGDVGLFRPQYMGLAAGRLMGHRKRLPMEASDDLQFSMKCVVGAIALIFGVHDVWDLFRPFFLELLVLSPEEMRTCFMGVSDLASNYQKGKR
ncbi:hypothetical protein ACHAWU_003147 [Discostella pseudostelligera]|uniref:RNase III domain-containing protein n=1 Tax=Discostella pseudostelligera TaxID=259834 RepID=A0ABD3M4B8_9STRA